MTYFINLIHHFLKQEAFFDQSKNIYRFTLQQLNLLKNLILFQYFHFNLNSFLIVGYRFLSKSKRMGHIGHCDENE